MESLNSSHYSRQKMQFSLSDDENSPTNNVTDLDLSENFDLSAHKEYSMRKNFNVLEKDLFLLSKEVKLLRAENSKLKSKLSISLREKEIHLETHAKEISKLTKENQKLKEISKEEKYKKENEALRAELEKCKKKFSEVLANSEKKASKLKHELGLQRTASIENMQRKNKEIDVRGK